MGRKFFSKSKNAVSVISGSDGPTSIFIVGKKRGLRNIRNVICQKNSRRKRDKVLARLTPNPHTLEEVRTFITVQYGAVEVFPPDRTYNSTFRNLKSALVREHAPELLGEPLEKYRPTDFSDEKAVAAFLNQSREYEEKAASMDEHLFPMDYHLYRIQLAPCGTLHVSIDFLHEHLSVNITYSKSSKKAVESYKNAERTIYAYYGVSKEDIEEHSQRLMTLLTVLSS